MSDKERKREEKRLAPKMLDKSGKTRAQLFWSRLKGQYLLQLMVIPGIVWLIIFMYVPMYGIVIAFKDYKPGQSFLGGKWVGIKHFKMFFSDKYAIQAIWNTLKISLIKLVIGFPAPIIFALLLNEVTRVRFKKFVQTVSYLPFFISWVVMWGLIYSILSVNGPLNEIFLALGINEKRVAFLTELDAFIPIAVISDLWKGVGWASILYLAAISNVPQEMYEAAIIDGANRFQRCMNITLPAIMPTVSIQLILAVSGILGSNFDQHLLLANANNISVARTIDLYVYTMGVSVGRYSYATAIGLARSVISFILLLIADRVTRLVSDGEHGLF